MIQELKKISIVDYLAENGHRPIETKGPTFKYRSPIRVEGKPSFHVRKSDNKWKDFGRSMKWSDIIDLVQEMQGISKGEAIAYLKGQDTKKSVVTKQEWTPGVVVDRTEPLTDNSLLEYLVSRGISVSVATKYCVQAWVKFPLGENPDKEHLYIGFKTDKGSYELRNRYSNAGKISSSPKYLTRIERGEDIVMFEGFIDFLTAETIKGSEIKKTIIILNSVTNLPYIFDSLSERHTDVFVDNDEAGDGVIKQFSSNGYNFKDQRALFGEFNDLNEWWQNKLKKYL